MLKAHSKVWQTHIGMPRFVPRTQVSRAPKRSDPTSATVATVYKSAQPVTQRVQVPISRVPRGSRRQRSALVQFTDPALDAEVGQRQHVGDAR